MNSTLLQLAHLIKILANVQTDKGELIIKGDAEVGKEVYIENENGEPVAPEDGEYETATQILVIADGKIAEIKDKEPEGGKAEEAEEPEVEEAPEVIEQEEPEEPEVEEAPEADPKDEEIAKLQAQIEELNNVIAEKDEEIGKLKAELEKSDAEPAEEQLKLQKQEHKSWFKPRF